MKYIKHGVVALVLLAFFPMILHAQTTTNINKEDQNEVLAFADELDGSSNEDRSGTNMNVRSQSIDAKPDTMISELNSAVLTPGQQVNVAYRKVDERDLIGGVSFVNMPEILEKNYITYALTGMEAFIGGYTGNTLWGMDASPLVIIDGVPREVNSVMPTEIDQISFLKGITAVTLYGSRAAKGVILITTKRGLPGNQIIHVRGNAGVSLAKSLPKYLGSAEYMTLYNEARVNDGLSELYTDEEIYHHSTGENPYRYPNVDYYSSEYLKEYNNTYDGTVEIAGGNEKAQYYTNMGFAKTGSFLNFGEAKNSGFERFNVRGNVDMKINKSLSAYVDAAVIYYNVKDANTNYWEGAATLRPNRFAPLIPISMIEESDEASMTFVENSDHIIDGKYLLGGTQLDQTNPIADIYAAGSRSLKRRQFQFNSGVNADLGSIVKGLSFSSKFGIDYHTTYTESFNNEYAVYEPTWNTYSGTDLISSLEKFGQDASSRNLSVSSSFFRQTISVSAQLNYLTKINNKHNFSAALVAGGFQQAISSEYHRIANANMGLYLGYNYKEKYYLDFNGSIMHSARMPDANRQAFSPTFTAGWRLSNEGFLASSEVIDNLMLTVSGGILHTDLDVDDYYLYEQIYSQSDGTWFSWRDGLLVRSTDSRRGENLDMTLPKREEINFGLNASLLDRLVTLNGSVFVSKMTGMVVQNNVLFPSYFSTGWPQSSFIPYVNHDEDERVGIDFNLNLNKQIGQVDMSLGFSGLFIRTRATKRAENVENDYQHREGKPLDAIWGLENKGFFKDQEDIDNSPEQAFGEVKPGDIKYKDQNGDGVINAQDEVYLGKSAWFGTPLTLGVNLTAKWKGFTFFALGTYRSGAKAIKNSNYFMVDGDDKYSEVVRDRWTEETKNTATFPRLTTMANNNNFRTSDFWMYNPDYFNLSKVQVSYSFPESMFEDKFIGGLDMYISGANLLMIAPNREILELNIGSSPQTRFFNLGVKAQF